jgi:hypothetical protein
VKALEIEQLVIKEDIEAFTTSIVSDVIATGASWPFVTIPDFERRGRVFNKIARSSFVGVFPVVSEYNRVSYEQFSIDHQDWIREGLGIQQRAPEETRRPTNIPRFIYRTRFNGSKAEQQPVNESAVDVNHALYVPIWQQAPAPENSTLINFDMLHDQV